MQIYKYFSGKFLSGENRFVFANGGPREAPEAQLQKEVSQEIDWYFKEIDRAGDNTERLEALVEHALNKLAAKYKDRIDTAQKAQKAALEMLVDRACDIDGDGKLNTTQEKDLKARIVDQLKPIREQIDGAADKANEGIRNVVVNAAEMRKEAEKGGQVGFIDDINKYGDKGVKDAYAAYQDAKSDFSGLLAQYPGLSSADLEKPDAVVVDIIIDNLDDKATAGDRNLKLARGRGKLPEIAEAKLKELKDAKAKIRPLQNQLLAAIDVWKAKEEQKVKEGYGKGRVEAQGLVKRIDQEKLKILADEQRGQDVRAAETEIGTQRAELQKELDDLQAEKTKAEKRQSALALEVEESRMVLKRAKEACGLYGAVNPDSHDDVLAALDTMADSGVKEYKLARARGKLEGVAIAKHKQLVIYGRQLKQAEGAYAAAGKEVARLDGKLDAAEDRLARFEDRSEGRMKYVEKYSVKPESTARAQMKRKADAALAQSAAIAKAAPASAVGRAAGYKGVPEVGAALKQSPDVAQEVKLYTVKPGDAMERIAKKFYGRDVSTQFALDLQKKSLGKVELLKGGKQSLIQIGQVIKLPKTFQGKNRID